MDLRAQEGAVAVTTALVLIVLVLLAAFLVDMGATRADARSDQLLADSAVMAAATHDGTGQEQCEQAVAFLAANVDAGPVSDTCASLPASCHSGTTPTPTPPMTIGPFVLVVTHPVANTDPAMVVEGQTVDAGSTGRDGNPCHRIKVEVTRARDYVFAPVGGTSSSGSASNDAVAIRNVEDDPREFATLVLLEQRECQELNVTGGGGVIVQNEYDASGTVTAAGVIHLDSDGLDSGSSCNGSKRIVDPGASGNSIICSGVDARDPDPLTAENEQLVAMFTTHDCEPLPYDRDVLDDTMRVKGSTNVALPRFLAGGVQDHQLESDPLTVDFRITRSIVDHEYNCLHGAGNYPTTQPQYPSSSLVEPIPRCTDSNRTPHVDELITATMGAGAPAGFTTVGCSPASPVVAQYVYIDCNQMPSATYEADVVVLEGGSAGPHGINGGTITVTPHSAGSAILVIRDGNIQMSGSDSLTFDRTFVYMHDGNMTINGGENLTWHAPDVEGYHPDTGVATGCQPVTVTPGLDVPHPSCFENLALWTNTTGNPTGVHSMAGDGEIDVRGVFFGPKAVFDLSGSGNSPGAPLRMEDAQFFTRKLDVSGGNGVAMKPNPNIFLETPPPAIALIR